MTHTLYFTGAMPNSYDVALRTRVVAAYESGAGTALGGGDLIRRGPPHGLAVGDPVARHRFRRGIARTTRGEGRSITS